MPVASEPRSVSVEEHFVALLAAVDSPRFERHDDADVVVYTSDIPHPLCSGALAPRFAADVAEARTDDVLDRLIARGQPFQWWAGPSSMPSFSPDWLLRRGLEAAAPMPGMHLDLMQADLPPTDGDIRRCASPSEHLAATATFLAGFDAPLELVDDFDHMLSSVPTTSDQQMIVLHAFVDDQPAGTGMVAAIGSVAGLYNIAVLPDARNRGLGAAITVELLRAGAAAGCSEAILHSSEMGFPVYRSLGFETVCDVQTYVWVPPGSP
ncbi:MAG: GNAT family N-acetyltransferase [Acidimicrobiales bacterium]